MNNLIHELKFALYATKKNIQNNTELRTSFIMNVVGMAINNCSLIIIWVYFVKSVGVIGGWAALDIIALQGFTAVTFGITFSAFFGVVHLPEYISSGAFDRFLLSPKNLIVRVATAKFRSSAVGDIVFGLICLGIYAVAIHANVYQILFTSILILAGSMVFFAMALIIHGVGFFFVDGGVVARGIFELFFTPALFHGGAFQGVMRFVFTFIVPSLAIGTLPVESVRDFSVEKLLLVTILTIVWFLISLKAFAWSVRHYESANFMTFGN